VERFKVLGFALAMAGLLASPALSSGRPAARGGLQPFPGSRVPGSYTVQAATVEEDAHWATPHAIRALEYAFYTVLRDCGPAARQPLVCDASSRDGSTPEGHPAGSHEDGVNIDVCYYMNTSDHDYCAFDRVVDHQGVGEPNYLDTKRQARFYCALAELDLAETATSGRGLVECCGVDQGVHPAVLRAIDALPRPAKERQRARSLIVSGGGWLRYHWNHTHVRFAIRDDSAAVTARIEQRMEPLLAAR
jgi:hypothetical protein